ncbi:MAG: molybdopterin-guanine dinucleotide biosynthesis protein MobA [Caulobacteraceae bacterium]|nr:molybdopterin-guanine dinucleotide biosynthesis protein MobA [Caulobacteraceae bacterium]
MTGLRLAALVMAAGMGRRFGGNKLTAQWEDGFLIDGALRAALAAPVEDVLVVTGADPKVIEAVEYHGDPRLRIVYAEEHAKGLSASLKTGVASLKPGVHGCFIFLGDMPRIPHEILPQLAEAVDNGAPAAAPVRHGVRGHPVILASALFDMIMDLQGDRGANGLLDALGTQLVTIPTTDAGILFDVDEP